MTQHDLSGLLKDFTSWLKYNEMVRLSLLCFKPRTDWSEKQMDFGRIVTAQYLKPDTDSDDYYWIGRLLTDIAIDYLTKEDKESPEPTPDDVIRLARLVDPSILANQSLRLIFSRKLEHLYASRLRHDISDIAPENKAIEASICSELARQKDREKNEIVKKLINDQLELWRDIQSMGPVIEQKLPNPQEAIKEPRQHRPRSRNRLTKDK